MMTSTFANQTSPVISSNQPHPTNVDDTDLSFTASSPIAKSLPVTNCKPSSCPVAKSSGDELMKNKENNLFHPLIMQF